VTVAWVNGQRVVATGNSFATPHLAGLCARILAKRPDLTPFQLKTVLYLTADNVWVGAAPPEDARAPNARGP
jgi:subtilisin